MTIVLFYVVSNSILCCTVPRKVLVWKSAAKSVLLARVSHIKYMQTGGRM
jgi:hypothetical protein